MKGQELTDFIVVNYCLRDRDSCVHFLTEIDFDTNNIEDIISPSAEIIYTSPFNAWYLVNVLMVSGPSICGVEIGKSHIVDHKGRVFSFCLIDSKFCTGSVSLILNGDFGIYFYTGNFCYYSGVTSSMCEQMIAAISTQSLTRLYFDATYYERNFKFLDYDELVYKISNIITEGDCKTVYLIVERNGLETLLIDVALSVKKTLPEKVFHVDSKRFQIMEILGHGSLFTTNEKLSRLYVRSSNFLKKKHGDEACYDLIFIKRRPEFCKDFQSYAHDGCHLFNFYSHSTHERCCSLINIFKPQSTIPTNQFRDDSNLITFKNVSDVFSKIDESTSSYNSETPLKIMKVKRDVNKNWSKKNLGSTNILPKKNDKTKNPDRTNTSSNETMMSNFSTSIEPTSSEKNFISSKTFIQLLPKNNVSNLPVRVMDGKQQLSVKKKSSRLKKKKKTNINNFIKSRGVLLNSNKIGCGSNNDGGSIFDLHKSLDTFREKIVQDNIINNFNSNNNHYITTKELSERKNTAPNQEEKCSSASIRNSREKNSTAAKLSFKINKEFFRKLLLFNLRYRKNSCSYKSVHKTLNTKSEVKLSAQITPNIIRQLLEHSIKTGGAAFRRKEGNRISHYQPSTPIQTNFESKDSIKQNDSQRLDNIVTAETEVESSVIRTEPQFNDNKLQEKLISVQEYTNNQYSAGYPSQSSHDMGMQKVKNSKLISENLLSSHASPDTTSELQLQSVENNSSPLISSVVNIDNLKTPSKLNVSNSNLITKSSTIANTNCPLLQPPEMTESVSESISLQCESKIAYTKSSSDTDSVQKFSTAENNCGIDLNDNNSAINNPSPKISFISKVSEEKNILIPESNVEFMEVTVNEGEDASDLETDIRIKCLSDTNIYQKNNTTSESNIECQELSNDRLESISNLILQESTCLIKIHHKTNFNANSSDNDSIEMVNSLLDANKIHGLDYNLKCIELANDIDKHCSDSILRQSPDLNKQLVLRGFAANHSTNNTASLTKEMKSETNNCSDLVFLLEKNSKEIAAVKTVGNIELGNIPDSVLHDNDRLTVHDSRTNAGILNNSLEGLVESQSITDKDNCVFDVTITNSLQVVKSPNVTSNKADNVSDTALGSKLLGIVTSPARVASSGAIAHLADTHNSLLRLSDNLPSSCGQEADSNVMHEKIREPFKGASALSLVKCHSSVEMKTSDSLPGKINHHLIDDRSIIGKNKISGLINVEIRLDRNLEKNTGYFYSLSDECFLPTSHQNSFIGFEEPTRNKEKENYKKFLKYLLRISRMKKYKYL